MLQYVKNDADFESEVRSARNLQTQLLFDDFDIFYGQPPGGKSVRKFGGNVIPLATQNNVLQFLAADPAGLLELYLFDLNTKTMTLSQQSRMSPIIKTGTYVAKCK